ncbi:hypothetical protein VW29_19325 [Devosia limi DSM 17137]|uniref:Uncharacterized protein n=1 Tax=Devosia limi DSM 17137 TaxID=1121477 RepID=A0A0F5L3M1_9HYPH|nr:hypothetical protein [Devosia limi]KKB76799.1 hypothetical protein VW29_19325 [Devosia limi DSM 17137]
MIEKARHALIGHNAACSFWEQRALLKKAHDIGLRAEAPGGIALKCFLYDGGDRLVSKEHPSLTWHTLIFVTHWCLKGPIAVLRARLHAVLGLLSVLQTLVLIHFYQQRFDKS